MRRVVASPARKSTTARHFLLHGGRYVLLHLPCFPGPRKRPCRPAEARSSVAGVSLDAPADARLKGCPHALAPPSTVPASPHLGPSQRATPGGGTAGRLLPAPH